MRALKNVRSPDGVVYLTFDDGPDAASTPLILDALERWGVRATFFVIAERARKEPALIERIRRAGHGIGNHSLDHGYRNFFRGRQAMLEWIRRSEEILQAEIGGPTVGFRPPAGVRTPELHWALRELGMPLVMWRQRFFDAVLPLSSKRAARAAAACQPGDIVLLHDRQPEQRVRGFLSALEDYVDGVRAKGYKFDSLNRESCLGADL